MSSDLGVSDEKLDAVLNWESSGLFDERERVALAYADAMTFTDREVDDDLFAIVCRHFTDDEIVELTMVIAWENSSSTFNRALRIPSQGLWKRRP